MNTKRGQFSSRFGFILAATGSAVGLGNIWGFPTQTTENGGAAFVFVYAILAFLLAYPALMAELTLGRYSGQNIVTTFQDLARTRIGRIFGGAAGYYGVLVACLILSFYTIVAGWMLAYFCSSFLTLFGMNEAAAWFVEDGILRNLVFSSLFAILTMTIIARGVENGIEKWSIRLMPSLILLFVVLIIYVLTQDGAIEGLKQYLLPNPKQLGNPDLIISAMGQAFFSLSLGVGTMLIYGSYLSKREDLPSVGAAVTLVDLGVAFLAGLLIIPAIFVAQNSGIQVYSDSGELVAGPGLILQVLPALFASTGVLGAVVSILFFALMSIASLTSSISMLEVAVSVTVEKTQRSRLKLTFIIGALILGVSWLIVLNFERLFGFVINLTTVYSQPLLGVVMCIFVGWVMYRHKLLQELKLGNEEVEKTMFWKVWPVYVRFICPALILLVVYNSF